MPVSCGPLARPAHVYLFVVDGDIVRSTFVTSMIGQESMGFFIPSQRGSGKPTN
jgi:hypothetical protein